MLALPVGIVGQVLGEREQLVPGDVVAFVDLRAAAVVQPVLDDVVVVGLAAEVGRAVKFSSTRSCVWKTPQYTPSRYRW